jgi:cell division protein FtsW
MLKNCAIILSISVAILLALGLIMLASTSAWVKGVEDPYYFVQRQSVMAVIGIIGAICMARISLDGARKWAPYIFFVTCVLLVLCFVPGIGVTIYGSSRWIHVPLVGQFQPSEFAKIVVVLCLATWFAKWQMEVRSFWRGFIIPGVIAGIPTLLIAAETDIGSALALSVAVGAMLYSVGTRLIYLVPTALSAMGAAAWFIYNDQNRWSRIEAWLDLEKHQLDKGMQQWRALLALGNGGPTGVGLGNGYEKFGTLTFAHIDFIFPVIGEELGLRVTLLVVLCYVLIALSGCGIAIQAKSIFNRCVALGLTCVIVVPAIVNIGVTTAVLPNDGLPLPFVSYGGTSLVFSLCAVGMLIGIHYRSISRGVFEFPLNQEKRLAVRL